MTDLSHQDVQQILDLVEKSPYDFFELQSGDFRLTVSKNGLPTGAVAPVGQVADSPMLTLPAPSAPGPTAASAPIASSPVRTTPAETEVRGTPASTEAEGLIAVKAPIVGTFYAQAEPGALPYVQLGSQVDEETTVGLVEVMKVFNAVRAGVRGTVEKILVQNAEFVEFGQPLFLIRPDAA